MNADRSKKHNAVLSASILLAYIAFLFIAGEVLLRTYHKFRFGVPFAGSPFFRYDKDLGWEGKKVFGNPASKKIKVFFIGDSFTNGAGIDEDGLYYNVAGKILNVEIFAYGGVAYGTVQEYIALDRYLDEIKPDLVVLQVSCGNDIVNNSWELDSASFDSNSLITRPYLINGKIEYRFPRRWGRLKIFLSSYSRAFYFAINRADRLFSRLTHNGRLHGVEDDISKKGADFAGFKEAVLATDAIIRKMKDRIGNIPMVAFAADDSQPYMEEFKKIFRANNMEFIEDVPKAIRQAAGRGIDVALRGNDFHWNGAGHKICGEFLAEELRRRGFGI